MFFLFKEIPVIYHIFMVHFQALNTPPMFTFSLCSVERAAATQLLRLCQALGPEKVWQRDGRGWTWQLSELEKEFGR